MINVGLDLLDQEKTLATELVSPFDSNKPCIFISECLIMYLGRVGKIKFLKDLSAVAAAGSVLILQFMDVSQTEELIINPEHLDAGLSRDEITSTMLPLGWAEFEFFRFGEE